MFLAASFALLFLTIYVYFRFFAFNYFSRHGIPHEPPSTPFGNIPLDYITGKMSLGQVFKNSTARFCKNHHRFHGFYVCHRPILVVHDAELIKSIYVKEFARFSDRGWYSYENIDILTDNFVMQRVDKWRRLKNLLTPLFTPTQLKRVHPMIVETSHELVRAIDVKLRGSNTVDVLDMIMRYSADIFSTLIYGFSYNSLTNPENVFQTYCTKATQVGKWRTLPAYFFPGALANLRIGMLSNEVKDFFSKVYQDTVEHRRRKKIVQNDLMNVMIQLMDKGRVDDEHAYDSFNSKEEDDRLKMSEGIAHAFIFFVAAFETTSLTMSYCLLELAKNQDVQEKLRHEVDLVAESPEAFTYDAIAGMEYMEMVISETLRKHPSGSFASRICTEDFPIPGTNFTIPKGMRVLMSPVGIHHNPDFYPDPEKFDPTRFNEENMAARSPYLHIPFGKGPRFCIGQRLGLAQTKQAIASLLREYTFKICDQTVLPLKLCPEVTVQVPVHGIYLRVERRAS